MSGEIRVRRHTDGLVALEFRPGRWAVFRLDSTGGMCDVSTDYVSGRGWSELLVAELPEPDGQAPVDDVPFWDTNVGRIFGDDAHEFINNYGFDNLNEVRSDALKMLAAIAACERYRQEIH